MSAAFLQKRTRYDRRRSLAWAAAAGAALFGLVAAERPGSARHHHAKNKNESATNAPDAEKSEGRDRADKPGKKDQKEDKISHAAAALIEQGRAALLAKDYAAAQTALTAAYRQSPALEILFLLGKVAVGQGRGVAARDLLRRYLQESAGEGESANQKEAQQLSENEVGPIGEVEVLGTRGALVLVDEQLVGALPLPLPLLLPLGPHKVTVELGAQRVEEQIKILSGQTAQMRFNQRTAVVVVSLPPAIVLLPEGPAEPPAHKRLALALQQAATAEHQAVVTREQAVAQVPKLAGCLDTLACQLDLLTQNEAPYALRIKLSERPQGVPGQAQDPAGSGPATAGTGNGGLRTFHLELQLIDASAGAVAATATPGCGACTLEQTAAAAAAALGPLLQQAASRERGSVEINSEPSDAQVLLAGEPIGVTPYRASRFVGSYPLVVQKSGYKSFQAPLVITAGQAAVVNAVLSAAAVEIAPAAQEPAPTASAQPASADRPARPLWRVLTGLALIGGGVTVAGFGAGALAVHGQCDLEGAPGVCLARYNTLVPGALLVGGGALLIGGGIALAAVPSRPRPRAQLAVLPSLGGVSLHLGGSF